MPKQNPFRIFIMAKPPSGFRSGPSRKACRLLFRNKTHRTVNILWVDYNGKETNYGIIAPCSIKSIHSYEGHPWLCVDTFSKRRLLINNGDYFIPTCPEVQPGDSLPIFQVKISLPIFSLRDRCADAVSRRMNCEDDIQKLEIPTSLKELLVDCYQNFNSF